MFVLYNKSLSFDGNNGAILYGYGGYNIARQPDFSVSRLLFLKHFGGVYAIANIRGGGFLNFGIIKLIFFIFLVNTAKNGTKKECVTKSKMFSMTLYMQRKNLQDLNTPNQKSIFIFFDLL